MAPPTLVPPSCAGEPTEVARAVEREQKDDEPRGERLIRLNDFPARGGEVEVSEGRLRRIETKSPARLTWASRFTEARTIGLVDVTARYQTEEVAPGREPICRRGNRPAPAPYGRGVLGGARAGALAVGALVVAALAMAAWRGDQLTAPLALA